MGGYMPEKQIEILLVEDSPVDADLTREALKQGKVLVSLNHVQDGVEAMAYLRRESKYKDVPRPDLVLLDLNMPRKDGREVLQEMKSDPHLKSIPVVILTTSTAEADILRAYNLGTNCYITKPVGLSEFMKVVDSIEEFWFQVVKLPTRM